MKKEEQGKVEEKENKQEDARENDGEKQKNEILCTRLGFHNRHNILNEQMNAQCLSHSSFVVAAAAAVCCCCCCCCRCSVLLLNPTLI